MCVCVVVVVVVLWEAQLDGFTGFIDTKTSIHDFVHRC